MVDPEAGLVLTQIAPAPREWLSLRKSSMDLYHTTTWSGLETILADGVLRPTSFSKDDLSNAVLGALESCHLQIVWLSSQRWIRSRFGAYVLTFRSTEVLTPLIVPLGKHNGGRCFLAVPPFLASHIAGRIDMAPIDPAVEPRWKPSGPKDRIDILVGWPVPAPDRIEFTSSVNVGDSMIQVTETSAKARFAAKMLAEQDHRFDRALAPECDTIGDLLRVIVGGYHDVFEKAVIEADPTIVASRQTFLDLALQSVIEDDLALARRCAAQIGDYSGVAEELAIRASNHFQRDFDANGLMKAADS